MFNREVICEGLITSSEILHQMKESFTPVHAYDPIINVAIKIYIVQFSSTEWYREKLQINKMVGWLD